MDRILERVFAFAEKGDWAKAEKLLDRLLMGKPWDKKLLLSKAKLRKRMWIASNCEDYHLLTDCFHLFSRCHLLTGNPEAGINAATFLLLMGDEQEALRKATEVARNCRTRIMGGNRELDGYYAAIVAEANLIMGNLEAAEIWYDTAYSEDIKIAESFRENMELILEHIGTESKIAMKIRSSLRA